ncbi:MAG: glucose 1-dehydrogenase [Abditibacteriaceae bacterium]
MDFKNKVALVTGSSRGIGRAIALRLARDGADVIVHYSSNEDGAKQTVAEIKKMERRAVLVQADLADLNTIKTACSTIKRTFGAIDILVNNAGYAKYDTLEKVSVEDFDEVFNINVKGLFFLTQEVSKIVNDGGCIINISSGITGARVAGGSVYAGSKAAIEAFTRCWAAELGSRNITVNTISPGMTKTEMLMEVVPQVAREAAVQSTLLGRLGEPEDIAGAVALLCSDEARWITAQNVKVNGGFE